MDGPYGVLSVLEALHPKLVMTLGGICRRCDGLPPATLAKGHIPPFERPLVENKIGGFVFYF